MQWTERIKALRISKWAILILAIAIVVFTVVTIYGLNIGNFIISVKDRNDRGNVNLLLSQYEDYSAATPLLSAKGLKEQADSTHSAIPTSREMVKGIGAKNDEIFKRYMAFSFYLMNRSTTMIDFEYTFEIKSDSHLLYRVLRVWIIESGVNDEISNDQIYGFHDDETIDEYKTNIGAEMYPTENYVTETTVAVQQRQNFDVDSVIKFTVILWLEGHEPLCDNRLIGATLKCSMDFVAK